MCGCGGGSWHCWCAYASAELAVALEQGLQHHSGTMLCGSCGIHDSRLAFRNSASCRQLLLGREGLVEPPDVLPACRKPPAKTLPAPCNNQPGLPVVSMPASSPGGAPASCMHQARLIPLSESPLGEVPLRCPCKGIATTAGPCRSKAAWRQQLLGQNVHRLAAERLQRGLAGLKAQGVAVRELRLAKLDAARRRGRAQRAPGSGKGRPEGAIGDAVWIGEACAIISATLHLLQRLKDQVGG